MANALARVALLLFVASWSLGGTNAQENRHPPHENPLHQQVVTENGGVDPYQNWKNRNDGSCCHGVHCRPLDPKQVRENAHGMEVQVYGEWCPVEPWMFLKVGKSPDWSKHHACVNDGNDEGGTTKPCQRLICFAGLPYH